MAGTITLEAHESKVHMAESKYRTREKCGSLEAFDWAEAEMDLDLLKVIKSLVETINQLFRIFGSRIQEDDGKLPPEGIAKSREIIDRLASRELPQEAGDVFDWTVKLLDEIIREWASSAQAEEANSGGAAAPAISLSFPKELLRIGAVAARTSSAESIKEGAASLNKVIATIYGPVGRVEITPDQPLRLVLDERWSSVFERINAAIHNGKSFLDIDETLRPITNGNLEELETLKNVIRSRSRGWLSVVVIPQEENPGN